MGVLFDGWAGEIRPTLAPHADRAHVALEVRRSSLRHEPAARHLEDRINGTVHVPDRRHGTTRADLELVLGETTTLPIGALPDGRAVVLDVRVTR